MTAFYLGSSAKANRSKTLLDSNCYCSLSLHGNIFTPEFSYCNYCNGVVHTILSTQLPLENDQALP